MEVYYGLAFLCPLFLVVKRAADEILAEAKKPRIEVRTVLLVQIVGGGRLYQVLIYFYSSSVGLPILISVHVSWNGLEFQPLI